MQCAICRRDTFGKYCPKCRNEIERDHYDKHVGKLLRSSSIWDRMKGAWMKVLNP